MTYKVKWDNGCGDHFATVVEAANKEEAILRATKVIDRFGDPKLFWDTESDYIVVEEFIDSWAIDMPWLRDWEEFSHESQWMEPRY